MQRRTATFMLLGMLSALFVGLIAAPASAEITQGSCRGSATFPDKPTDKVLDAARPRSQVFEAPLSATVAYTGDLGPGAAESDEEVPFEGGVKLRIPRTSISIASWEGDTTAVSDAGSYTYDVPDIVPQGTGALELTAFHVHQGHPRCEAIVSVAVEGDPGAVAIVAGALTALAGAGVVLAGRAKA